MKKTQQTDRSKKRKATVAYIAALFSLAAWIAANQNKEDEE